jgi:predicted RNA-binding protein with PUA-like domain
MRTERDLGDTADTTSGSEPRHRWLMKTEPDGYSLDDLASAPDRTTMWEGVRNYTVRNWMRDDMAVGDGVFFYHSNCAVPGIVGLAEISRTAYPDPTQFDPTSRYFDPKSNPQDPRWLVVDVRFVRRLARTITLAELKARADDLEDFPLVKRGNRLSVMPVTASQWTKVLALEGAEPAV